MFKLVALLTLVVCLAVGSAAADDAVTVSPLKAAFRHARAEQNIDVVLPTLKAATLYVIVAEIPDSGGATDYIRTTSPDPGRWCVTVAEDEATLKDIPWPKRKMNGADLLKELPPELEIIIAYGDGADYLTREQLDWFRQNE